MSKNKSTADKPSFEVGTQHLLKEYLPKEWYMLYKKKCLELRIPPLSYPHMTNIKKGRYSNTKHFNVLLNIAQEELNQTIELEQQLIESNRKLQAIRNVQV